MPSTTRTRNGAFRLLTYILYGQYSHMNVSPQHGYVQLGSVRKLARILGTESKHVNAWLQYLESLGYISNLTYSQNRRQAKFSVRIPSNVIYQQGNTTIGNSSV